MEAILAEWGTKKDPIKLVQDETGQHFLQDNSGKCKISITGSLEKVIAHLSYKAPRVQKYKPRPGFEFYANEIHGRETDSMGVAKSGLGIINVTL
jgi:hypothetical protein